MLLYMNVKGEIMSNKKNNSAKQKRLAEKQRLEKKKMLLEMRKEISKLENEIKHSKIGNTKVYALRGLKIVLRTGQLIAPFVVTAGITIGGFAALGGTPFYRDKHKQKLEMMKELDSLGNIRYEQQYEEYANSSSVISYYSKWNFVEDNLYSRDIETYALGDITEEQILKLINDDVQSLREILGEPISKKKETKNNLTEEELQSDPFLQAMIYSKFDDDFIMVKESSSDNIGLTLLWVLVTVLAEIIPVVWRVESSDFDYEYCIRKIKEKHPTIDVEELAKKLEIKRNNYDRLTR